MNPFDTFNDPINMILNRSHSDTESEEEEHTCLWCQHLKNNTQWRVGTLIPGEQTQPASNITITRALEPFPDYVYVNNLEEALDLETDYMDVLMDATAK